MLFGLYLMFELFLLIGYFVYSYDTHLDTLVSENIHEKCILQNTLSASPFSPFFPLT